MSRGIFQFQVEKILKMETLGWSKTTLHI